VFDTGPHLQRDPYQPLLALEHVAGRAAEVAHVHSHDAAEQLTLKGNGPAVEWQRLAGPQPVTHKGLQASQGSIDAVKCCNDQASAVSSKGAS
jgi:hypothetical protein